MTNNDPRTVRLIREHDNLMRLNERSQLIHVEPIEVQPGYPPESYLITYTCRGVAHIDDSGHPELSELHRVRMDLRGVSVHTFPEQEPHLKWLTPIWHPNIDSEEPHHVCVNCVTSWFAPKSLDRLVLQLGEMIQYKDYHAKWTAPFPLNRKAATWVVEYAEPRGIITKNKPIDDRHLIRRVSASARRVTDRG